MQFIPHDYQKYTIDYMVSHPITAAIANSRRLLLERYMLTVKEESQIKRLALYPIRIM